MRANRVIVIETAKQLLRWWPLFKDGLRYFVAECGRELEEVDYMRQLMYIVSLGHERGFLAVLVSGAGEPYGYIAVVDNTSPFANKSVLVYDVFSNKKCPSAVVEMAAEAYAWAKSVGFVEVHAVSVRTCGNAVRWFERKMKFTKRFLLFTKRI